MQYPLLMLASIVGLMGGTAPLAAQARLHLVPEVGAGTQFRTQELSKGIYGRRIDLWTYGAQIELVSKRRWTPTAALQRWNLRNEGCSDSSMCSESGWGAEVGVMYSVVPTSIVRPYGGIAYGLRFLAETDRYLQGRGGVDFTPRLSPVTFRVEGRYTDVRGPGRPLFLLNTGVRFALPRP
jgi:hypothetical protein